MIFLDKSTASICLVELTQCLHKAAFHVNLFLSKNRGVTSAQWGKSRLSFVQNYLPWISLLFFFRKKIFFLFPWSNRHNSCLHFWDFFFYYFFFNLFFIPCFSDFFLCQRFCLLLCFFFRISCLCLSVSNCLSVSKITEQVQLTFSTRMKEGYQEM